MAPEDRRSARRETTVTRADGLAVTVESATFVRVVGDIDTSNASRLAAAIDQPVSVRLDLTDVGFMDSSAMAVLTRAYTKHHVQGTELVICRINGMPRRAMELMGLDFMLCESARDQPSHSRRRDSA